MQRYQDYIIDLEGKPIANALITVRVAATPAHTGALATVYEDNGTTPKSSHPFPPDSYGNFHFFVADGRYDIEITRPNGQPYRIADVLIADPIAMRGPASGVAELDSNGKLPISRICMTSGGDPAKFLNQTGAFTIPAGGGGGSPDWASIQNKPATFPPSAHTHPQSDVTGLATSLAGKSDTGHGHAVADVTGLQAALDGKAAVSHGHAEAALTLNFPTHSNANDPAAGEKAALAGTSGAPGAGNKYVTDADARNSNARTPTAHTHAESEVTGLVADLAAKAALSHTHNASDINAGTLAAATLPDASTVAKGAVQLATDGQSAAGIVPQANDSRLSNARTPTAHTHPQSDVTGLVAALAAKQDALGFTPENSANKNAASGYAGLSAASKIAAAQISGVLASSDLTNDAALEKAANKGAANGYAPLNASSRVPMANIASGTPDGTKFVRDDGTLAVPGGGADPWTYVRLTSDFVTNSASAVDVTGLAFTPAANTRYEFEAVLLLRTTTTTVNPRAGLAWPTGMTDGVAQIIESQAATGTPLFASGNPNAALLIAVGGLPNTTQSWPARVSGMVLAGASPSGAVRVQLASETAGTNVTVKAESFIRYRTIP